MKRLPMVSWLTIAAALMAACRPAPQPIPRDRQAFVGTWQSRAGFSITIRPEGLADVQQNEAAGTPDSLSLAIKVAPASIGDIQVHFRGADRLQLIAPGLYGREYRVTRAPYRDGSELRLVLDRIPLTESHAPPN